MAHLFSVLLGGHTHSSPFLPPPSLWPLCPALSLVDTRQSITVEALGWVENPVRATHEAGKGCEATPASVGAGTKGEGKEQGESARGYRQTYQVVLRLTNLIWFCVKFIGKTFCERFEANVVLRLRRGIEGGGGWDWDKAPKRAYNWATWTLHASVYVVI